MAWKVLEIRDASGGRRSLLVWWCLSQCRSTILEIYKKRSEELATAKTRGGKKKYVGSGCYVWKMRRICFTSPAKPHLTNPVPLSHTRTSCSICSAMIMFQRIKGLSWIFQGARWSKFGVKTRPSGNLYFRRQHRGQVSPILSTLETLARTWA